MLWILTLKKKNSSGFVEASKQRIKKMMQLGQMAKPKIHNWKRDMKYINLGGPRWDVMEWPKTKMATIVNITC